MTYREDKIKILEMICAEMLPWEVCEDDQHVILDEDDFKEEGFSFNGAILILKDIFSIYSINKFEFVKTKEGKRAVALTVKTELEIYTKNYKYPETEFLDDSDYMQMYQTDPTPSKLTIAFNLNKGIYREDKKELSYPIKDTSKRFVIIKHVSRKNKVSIKELEKATNQKSTLIIKEISEINSNFKKELSVNDDLIIRIDTGGYSLNREKFDIKPFE